MVLLVGVAVVAVGDGLPMFGWGESSEEELGNTLSETSLLSTDNYQMRTGLERMTSDNHGFGQTKGFGSLEADEETFPDSSRVFESKSSSSSDLADPDADEDVDQDQDQDQDEDEDEDEYEDEDASLDEEEDENEDLDEGLLYHEESEGADISDSFSGGFNGGKFGPKVYGEPTVRDRTGSYDAAHGTSGFASESIGLENQQYGMPSNEEVDSGDKQHQSSIHGTSGTYNEDETVDEDDLRVDGIMSSDIAVDPGTTGDSDMEHDQFTGELDRNRFSADVPIVLSVSATQANGYVAVEGLKFMNTISLVCRHAVRDEATFALVSSARFVSHELVICEVPADLAVGFPPTVEFDL